jgi:predicted outer membrane protein
MRLLRSVTTLLVVVVAGLALPFAGSATGQQNPPPVATNVVQTEWGPMDGAARDMLVKVRLAGLWEGPAGQMGIEKGSALVKEAGEHLISGHAALDARVIELGQMLDVPLPETPNTDQQGWLREMTEAPADSEEFDKVYANRLRAAHGKVYNFLAQVRSGTRNTLIRDFANQCMTTVLDHITVLEATGKVDFTDTKNIPIATTAAAAPAPGQQPQAAGFVGGSPNSSLIMVIGGILIVITLVVLRVLRGGRAGQRFR